MARTFIGAGGNSIAADIYGPDGGSPVIFLHGGGQSRSAWKGAALAAGRAGYHAMSIDLRGHGESSWITTGDYRFAAYADDIAAIAAELGRPCALVGASLGGRAAILAAATYPLLISAILLADVAPRINDAATREMRDFFARSRRGFESVEDAAGTLAQLRESRGAKDPGKLLPYLRQENDRFHWRWDPRFAADEFIYHPGEIDDLEAAARRIAIPALLVRAGLSTVVTPEHLESFRRLIPHAEVREAPGIGHMLTGDANDAYGPMILDFLNRQIGALPTN